MIMIIITLISFITSISLFSDNLESKLPAISYNSSSNSASDDQNFCSKTLQEMSHTNQNNVVVRNLTSFTILSPFLWDEEHIITIFCSTELSYKQRTIKFHFNSLYEEINVSNAFSFSNNQTITSFPNTSINIIPQFPNYPSLNHLKSLSISLPKTAPNTIINFRLKKKRHTQKPFETFALNFPFSSELTTNQRELTLSSPSNAKWSINHQIFNHAENLLYERSNHTKYIYQKWSCGQIIPQTLMPTLLLSIDNNSIIKQISPYNEIIKQYTAAAKEILPEVKDQSLDDLLKNFFSHYQITPNHQDFNIGSPMQTYQNHFASPIQLAPLLIATLEKANFKPSLHLAINSTLPFTNSIFSLSLFQIPIIIIESFPPIIISNQPFASTTFQTVCIYGNNIGKISTINYISSQNNTSLKAEISISIPDTSNNSPVNYQINLPIVDNTTSHIIYLKNIIKRDFPDCKIIFSQNNPKFLTAQITQKHAISSDNKNLLFFYLPQLSQIKKHYNQYNFTIDTLFSLPQNYRIAYLPEDIISPKSSVKFSPTTNGFLCSEINHFSSIPQRQIILKKIP